MKPKLYIRQQPRRRTKLLVLTLIAVTRLILLSLSFAIVWLEMVNQLKLVDHFRFGNNLEDGLSIVHVVPRASLIGNAHYEPFLHVGLIKALSLLSPYRDWVLAREDNVGCDIWITRTALNSLTNRERLPIWGTFANLRCRPSDDAMSWRLAVVCYKNLIMELKTGWRGLSVLVYQLYVDSKPRSALCPHFAPHFVSDSSIDASGDERTNGGNQHKQIKHYLPPWHLVVAALAGLSGSWWGWRTLCSEMRENIATVVLLCGVGLWGYAVYGLLFWSFEL
jgi:hypothetical protein